MIPVKYFFKPLPFASDDLGFTAMRIGTPVILSVLCLFAGVGLLMTERFAEMYDRDLPTLFMFMSQRGISTIAIIWLVYMVLLGISQGWSVNEGLLTFIWVMFLLAAGYMLMVIMSLISVWCCCHMTLT